MTGFARALHYLSIVLTLIIGLSWLMFAVGEISDASKNTSEKIATEGGKSNTDNGTDATTSKSEHGVVRRTIDDAADKLTSPFDGIVSDDANVWAKRTVPAILGLLLYGVGFAVLSRWVVTRD